MIAPRLEPRDFDALRKVIREVAGISLGDKKQDLVAGRLAPRLRALGLTSFAQYLSFVASDATGAESRELINRITTNKTSFFREPHHFDFLRAKVIPEIVARAAAGGQKRIRIWSAGCSMGQEPWTIAMSVADALGSLSGWDVRILASDLDTNVLETAERATYDELAITDVPVSFQEKYFDAAPNGEYRVVASLRDLVTFRRLNLVEPASWNVRSRFDVIFCRNVAIYFDRPTQEVVFKGLAAVLEPSGYLMSGHSENLHWLSDVLRPLGNTVHVLAAGAAQAPSSSRLSAAPSRMSVAPSLVRSVRPPSGVRPAIVLPKNREVSIQVGGIHASAKGAVIRTTLGSCVAACLYDPEARVGGMNHFLLPEDPSGIRGPTNFGVHAMEVLINAVMKLGGDRKRMVAKLFGGAEQHLVSATAAGRKNAAFALQFLEEEGIQVVAQKLGGRDAMSVIFDTEDGKVRVKLLERTQDVALAERRYAASLVTHVHPVENDIVFFGTSR